MFLCFPDAVKNGVVNGLNLGERVLVPSIFPYLVISGILVKTGAFVNLCKKIKIGALSEPARELLIPSLFCGYPTGARLSAFAYDNGSITKQEYTLLFIFANIPGFGFAVSYLGGFFDSHILGILIYVSFLLASLTILWFFAKRMSTEHSDLLWQAEKSKEQRAAKISKELKEPKEPKEPKKQKISDALVESVSESSQTMVSLLFFVCFFASLIDLLEKAPLPAGFFPMGATFLEITTGLSLLAKSYPIEVIVFFCGFSGLSVMFQSLYFDKNRAVNFLRLFLGRIVYGTISVCYFVILRFLVFCFFSFLI